MCLEFFFKLDFANIRGIFFKKVHPHMIKNAQAKNQSFIFCSFRVYLADSKFHDFDFIGNLYIIGYREHLHLKFEVNWSNGSKVLHLL